MSVPEQTDEQFDTPWCTHTHAHTHLVSLYSSALDKILADALVSNKHQTTIIGEPVLLAFYV